MRFFIIREMAEPKTVYHCVCPTVLVKHLKKRYPTMVKIGVWFDTQNLCKYTRDHVSYVAFKPLRVAVELPAKKFIYCNELYNELYGDTFFQVSINTYRRLNTSTRCNLVMIDPTPQKCKTSSDIYYQYRIIPHTNATELEQLAETRLKEEEKHKQERVIRYMETHPELVRTQQHGYIQRLLDVLNEELHITGLTVTVLQRWIHKFRDNGGVQLTYMDKYANRRANVDKHRFYESEAPDYKFGNYSKTIALSQWHFS